MPDELIVFTHNDMDALSCMLNLEYNKPYQKKVYYHTNYQNIKEKTYDILQYIKQHKNKEIYILDISFSNNKPELLELIKTGAKITFIDHHLYTDGYFEDLEKFQNFTYLHRINYSAGLLTHVYLKNNGKNTNLDKLTKIMDVYDIWKKDSPLFEDAQLLNEYIGDCFKSMSLEYLMRIIVDNDYDLPSDYEKQLKIILQRIQNTKESLEKRKLIRRTPDIMIMFTDDYFNFIIKEEFKAGRQVCLIVNDYGIIRIRVSENSVLTKESKNYIRARFCGDSNTGHQNAFTYKIPNVSFDNIIEEIKLLSNIIQQEINKGKL